MIVLIICLSVLFLCSVFIFGKNFKLKEDVVLLSNSNRLFYAAAKNDLEKQKKILDREKELLKNEKKEAEENIREQVKNQSKEINDIKKSNELAIFEARETLLILADYHTNIGSIIDELRNQYASNTETLLEIIKLYETHMRYKQALEANFFKWFNQTTDQYKDSLKFASENRLN